MIRFLMLIVASLSAISYANFSYAVTIDLLCEMEIETLQEMVATPSKWTVSKNNNAKLAPADSTTRHTLSAISFSEDVNGAMILVPPERTTISKSNKQAFVSTWQFKPTQAIHYVCSYWDTAIQLSKGLPKKATTCYLEGKRNGATINAWCEIAQEKVASPEMSVDTSANAVAAPKIEEIAEDVALTPIVTPDETEILPKALAEESIPTADLETPAEITEVTKKDDSEAILALEPDVQDAFTPEETEPNTESSEADNADNAEDLEQNQADAI